MTAAAAAAAVAVHPDVVDAHVTTQARLIAQRDAAVAAAWAAIDDRDFFEVARLGEEIRALNGAIGARAAVMARHGICQETSR